MWLYAKILLKKFKKPYPNLEVLFYRRHIALGFPAQPTPEATGTPAEAAIAACYLPGSCDNCRTEGKGGEGG